MFDIDVVGKKIVGKEVVASPGYERALLPVWLANERVSTLTAGGVGSRAQALFRQNRIDFISGAMEGDPEKAVQEYLSGTLATGDNICDH